MVVRPRKLSFEKFLVLAAIGSLFVVIGGAGFYVYRDFRNHKTWTYNEYHNPMPDLEMGDGMPGPEGQPPATVRELVQPIKIVEVHYFMDGGTTGVRLCDHVGTNVWISFPSPPEFQNYPPGFRYDTLYVGSSVPNSPSARLPVSKAEAYMLCRSLRAALEDAKGDFDAMQQDGHPEKYSQKNMDLSAAYAMLENLKSCKRFYLEKDLKSLEEKIRRSSDQ